MRPVPHFLSVLLMGLILASRVAGVPAGEVHLLNDTEAEVYRLLAGHPDQQRPEFQLEPRLCEIARAHCEDMIARAFFGHVNPDGWGPNVRLSRAGYPLPEWYFQNGLETNFIESLYRSGSEGDSAAAAVAIWVGSPSHRVHVLAEDSFYRQEILVGVGYARDPATGFGYYAFVSAHPPLGETWRLPAGLVPRVIFDQSAGSIRFPGLRAQGVAQLYTSPDALSWRLAGCGRVSSAGEITLGGFPDVPVSFFRFEYVPDPP